MTKDVAIVIIEKELSKMNETNDYVLDSYSNLSICKAFARFNYYKYVKRYPLLWRINFKKLFKPDTTMRDLFVVNKRAIEESNRFWIIYWNTKSFVESFDIQGGLIGSGPFLIDKQTRQLYGTGSGLHGFVQKIKRGEVIDEDFLAQLVYTDIAH
ncbi:MAG: YrhB domain-containing protein [Saprospiraceae bacterium]